MELAKLSYEIGADGFNGDTMDGVSKIYYETGKSLYNISLGKYIHQIEP